MKHERVKILLHGAVQGVGFRPFVYRSATELGLTGWVLNSAQGLFLEAEGPRASLEKFITRLETNRPACSVVQSMECTWLDVRGYSSFEIRESDGHGEKSAFILPDLATCADCLYETSHPQDRRYRYPFTNCTHCGPRFSILESLPYDRPNTSMKNFTMCPECAAEYRDPRNRRFHAQPNACPNCGPQLALWDCSGHSLAERDDALRLVVQSLREGRIIAVKGIGGFQLMVDARNDTAVRRLRDRKHREEKPFALMYPDLASIQLDCDVSEAEERLLLSTAAPIVLLSRHSAAAIAGSVAPWNPYLGVMLPYSPLHHLLLQDFRGPLVATSGNLSDEPICIREEDALRQLGGIADVFLVHNRPIVRHVDDSVARVLMDREMILRRARGYAPLPIHVAGELPPLLAVGAHLKNTVALARGHEIFISQHIGDLETEPAYAAFQKVAADMENLQDSPPTLIACDCHPDYLSSKFAHEQSVPVVEIQHHFAHVVSCMAENDLDGPVLGVGWDGTGWGPDGTIWGGEFLLVKDGSFDRAAHFRTFRLPGGQAAIQQPRRIALGLLYEIFGEEIFHRPDLFPVREFTESEIPVLSRMLQRGLQSPVTSSAGRLFDAVASIIGLRQRVKFEGQAAMEMEFSITPGVTDAYPLAWRESRIWDWEPMIREILQDVHQLTSIGRIAAKFHNTLAAVIVQVAHNVGEPRVVLSGGCFQNKYLTELTVNRLRAEGFHPYWHQRVPTNDGGICLGQAIAAAKQAEVCVA